MRTIEHEDKEKVIAMVERLCRIMKIEVPNKNKIKKISGKYSVNLDINGAEPLPPLLFHGINGVDEKKHIKGNEFEREEITDEYIKRRNEIIKSIKEKRQK